MTILPTFDIEKLASEAAVVTVVPPSNGRPAWAWPAAPATRATVVPNFDVVRFAEEVAQVTVVPPPSDRPSWVWLNETSVPAWNLPANEIPAGELDLRAAFLLMHLDGVSTPRDIAQNSGIVLEETLSILTDALSRGFIRLQDNDSTVPSSPSFPPYGPPSGMREKM